MVKKGIININQNVSPRRNGNNRGFAYRLAIMWSLFPVDPVSQQAATTLKMRTQKHNSMYDDVFKDPIDKLQPVQAPIESTNDPRSQETGTSSSSVQHTTPIIRPKKRDAKKSSDKSGDSDISSSTRRSNRQGNIKVKRVESTPHRFWKNIPILLRDMTIL